MLFKQGKVPYGVCACETMKRYNKCMVTFSCFKVKIANRYVNGQQMHWSYCAMRSITRACTVLIYVKESLSVTNIV